MGFVPLTRYPWLMRDLCAIRAFYSLYELLTNPVDVEVSCYRSLSILFMSYLISMVITLSPSPSSLSILFMSYRPWGSRSSPCLSRRLSILFMSYWPSIHLSTTPWICPWLSILFMSYRPRKAARKAAWGSWSFYSLYELHDPARQLLDVNQWPSFYSLYELPP